MDDPRDSLFLCVLCNLPFSAENLYDLSKAQDPYFSFATMNSLSSILEYGINFLWAACGLREDSEPKQRFCALVN